MRIKSCLNCKYFQAEEEEDFTEETVLVQKPRCLHELSNGNTTGEMTYAGPCGRDKKLWERRKKVYLDIEVPETD